MLKTRQEVTQRQVEQLPLEGIDDSNLSLIAQSGRTAAAASVPRRDRAERDGIVRRIWRWRARPGLGIAALAIPGVGQLVAAGAIASSPSRRRSARRRGGATAATIDEVFASHGESKRMRPIRRPRQKGGTFVSVDTAQSGLDTSRVQQILYSSGGHSARAPGRNDQGGKGIGSSRPSLSAHYWPGPGARSLRAARSGRASARRNGGPGRHGCRWRADRRRGSRRRFHGRRGAAGMPPRGWRRRHRVRPRTG